MHPHHRTVGTANGNTERGRRGACGKQADGTDSCIGVRVIRVPHVCHFIPQGRVPLWRLLTISIIIHAVGTLFYLGYRSFGSALIITAIEGAAQTLAILPLYDLAARATPRGSEALGYSVMMSVWNLTAALSDLAGAYLHDRFHLSILQLVWLNAGTTALVLVAVPLLPAALMRRRDGE